MNSLQSAAQLPLAAIELPEKGNITVPANLIADIYSQFTGFFCIIL